MLGGVLRGGRAFADISKVEKTMRDVKRLSARIKDIRIKTDFTESCQIFFDG